MRCCLGGGRGTWPIIGEVRVAVAWYRKGLHARIVFAAPMALVTMGDYGWSKNSVASQGNEVVVDGWVLYTQR